MITFRPMVESDAHALVLQPHQELVDRQEIITQPGDRWSFFSDDALVAIGGAIELMPGRAWVWLLLDPKAPMLGLTRYLRAFISELGFRRTEMYVDAMFAPGCRWAHLLGFTNETPEPMSGFFSNGHAAYLYARVG